MRLCERGVWHADTFRLMPIKVNRFMLQPKLNEEEEL